MLQTGAMAKQTRRHFLRITALSGAGLVFGCDRPAGLVGVDEDGGTMLRDELDGGVLREDAGVDAGQPLPPDEPERVAEAFNFPLGLASGDLEPTRGVLWTRYSGMATVRLWAAGSLALGAFILHAVRPADSRAA